MDTNQRPTACVLIIGNEILSGRTQDVNLNFLASNLNDLGVVLVEARIIADVESAIISAVKRDFGVKDMGNSIPGHGGFLDRIDSLSTTSSPFFHLIYFMVIA